MSAERFTLDTNILVYSVDIKAGYRREAAADILKAAARRNCWLTLQAVSEFYAVVTRKGVVPPPEAADQVRDWLDIFSCAAASADAVRFALSASIARRASYWDALLVATAAEAGCKVILSEDLSDRADLGGVKVQNPFSRSEIAASARRLLGLT
jgi:predicted nucleic acid-binding protein